MITDEQHRKVCTHRGDGARRGPTGPDTVAIAQMWKWQNRPTSGSEQRVKVSGQGSEVNLSRALPCPTFSDADELVNAAVSLSTWKDSAVSMSDGGRTTQTTRPHTLKHESTAKTERGNRQQRADNGWVARGRARYVGGQSALMPPPTGATFLWCVKGLISRSVAAKS